MSRKSRNYRRPESTPGEGNASATVEGGVPVSGISGLPIVSMVLYYLATLTVMVFHQLSGTVMLAGGIVLFIRPLLRLLRKVLWNQWELINEECLAPNSTPQGFDRRPLVVMVTAAIALTLMQYWGKREDFQFIADNYWTGIRGSPYFDLAGCAYWSVCRILGYVAIPCLVILFMPGERIRDHGLSFTGITRHAWIYGLLFLIAFPAIVMVSFDESFQYKYPFYGLASRSWTDFLVWELLYGLQFLSLEFFFRGFMLHGTKRALGAYSIFAMVVPYCMIHYSKPWAETFAAIATGIVLGTLSLRTRSIWCGVFIHLSVAFSMDILAIAQKVGWSGRAGLGS